MCKQLEVFIFIELKMSKDISQKYTAELIDESYDGGSTNAGTIYTGSAIPNVLGTL